MTKTKSKLVIQLMGEESRKEILNDYGFVPPYLHVGMYSICGGHVISTNYTFETSFKVTKRDHDFKQTVLYKKK